MCLGHSKSTSGHALEYYYILYYSDSLVTSNVNLGRTALEWLSKAVLLENLKQCPLSHWTSFFLEISLTALSQKKFTPDIFLHASSKYSVNLFRFFFLSLRSLWGTRKAVGRVFLSFQNGLVIESILWVFLRIDILASQLTPDENGSFIRGKWWRKSVLPTYATNSW